MKPMRSIRHKLFIGVLITTVSALVISGLAMILYDLRDHRQRLIQDMVTQGQLLGLTVAPALQFNDQKLAAESLSLLETRPQILAAAVYDADGTLFASYSRPGGTATEFPEMPEEEKQQLAGSSYVSFQPIVSHGDRLGTIYLKAEFLLIERVWQYAGIVLAGAVLALIVSSLLSLWIQASLTRPILRIAKLARRITEQKDYSLRAEQRTSDEAGQLADAFNDLLSEVEQRSAALELSNTELHQRIREREEADRAFRGSEARYRTLVNAMTSVVWSADSDGCFINDQEPWDAYTGQTPEQHKNHGWFSAFHKGDHKTIIDLWTKAHRDGTPLRCEVRLWHAISERYRYVILRAVPLHDRDGNILEWIGTADDIDDRRRATDEIQRLNAELEQRVAARTAELESTNKELEAFSYSVSHDLRTPLRAIDGFSQALLEDYSEQLDDTGRDYLARVRSGAQRMGHLIDDLLKLARVSRSPLVREQIDLSVIARDITDELRASDPDRDVDIEIPPHLDTVGDPRLMRIALDNLLNNAWKYTGKRARARISFGECNDKGKPCYCVEDNGAGFDMSYADKLFGAFQRLHDAKDYPGTGIGLATVQRIIHRHGGHIWADSKPGEGSTFYFTLS